MTIEISNTTPLPAKIYAGEGIADPVPPAEASAGSATATSKGKYQDQKGLTLPFVIGQQENGNGHGRRRIGNA